MNTTNSGGQPKPQRRNVNPSAQGADVKQGRTPVKRPVSNNRSVPPSARKQVPSKTAKPVRKNVKKVPQKQAPQNNSLVKFLMVGVVIVLFILVGVRTFIFYQDETDLLIQEVTIEAGSAKPDISMYFREEPAFPQLVNTNLNFDEVNTDLPQTISFNIQMYGRNFPCRLIIADTIPPEGQGITQKIFTCDEIPDAASCITGIEDITDVVAT